MNDFEEAVVSYAVKNLTKRQIEILRLMRSGKELVCETGTVTILDWPDISWDQAWRLAVLFSGLTGPGTSYIYGMP